MQYDMILPVVTGASGVFAGCAVLYSKLRPYIPCKVNCWFCNKDTKVTFRSRESWYCPSCEQYNGFTEDGDYNRDLPAQYCESLNLTPHRQRRERRLVREQHENNPLSQGNGFCHTCNLNQSLKVRALADYTPIHPDNYDKEIEEYRKRLDNTYALCRACEATLHQTLGKQDSWLKPKLIAWRLKMTAENKSKIILNSHKGYRGMSFLLHVLRFIGLLISVMLFLCNLHHLQQDSGKHILELDFGLGLQQHLEALYLFVPPLVIAGLALLLISIFGSGKEVLLVSDAITSFIWVGLLAVSSSKELLSNKDYNSLQVMVSGVTVLFNAWTLVVPRNGNGIKSPSRHTLNKSGLSDTSTHKLEDTQTAMNSNLNDSSHNLSFSSLSKTNIAPSQPISIPPTTSYLRSETPPIPVTSQNLDTTLGSLKISTPLKSNQSATQPSPWLLFSDKPAHTSPKLNGSYCNQRNLVRPPRFTIKNITQSSWVAGGYWGHPVSPTRDVPSSPITQIPSPNHLFPLSRSSSQSSGFVSQSSGPTSFRTQGLSSLPNSRHGSHCGDLDHASVLSEPAYKTWGSVHSLYPSDSISQCDQPIHHRLPKSDVQSLHSFNSACSDSLRYTPPSPIANSSFMFQSTHGSLSDNSLSDRHLLNGTVLNGREGSVNSVQSGSVKFDENTSGSRNPWFAFFLGMSFAANGFLFALLYIRSDIRAFFGS